MDRDVAIDRLPDTYRRIVRWLDGGVSEREIAQRLGLGVESVAPLVTVARAKLERLQGDAAVRAEPAPPR